jgi:hypothetical protein
MDYLGVCYCRCKPPFAGKECEDPYSQVLLVKSACLAKLATKYFFIMEGLISEIFRRLRFQCGSREHPWSC